MTAQPQPPVPQPPVPQPPVPQPPMPRPPSNLSRWLMGGGDTHNARRYAWWQVMCLTGVDYFSTLGYQPGIAALAAGAVSPLATLVLVALTLFGALPVYRRVAAESPHGEGSVSMLERLLGYWPGKLLVLVLLGFMATDFIITITLSAADASAHLLENPFFKTALAGQQVPVTLALVLLLGAVFLRGFREAIGISVLLVALYLGLNAAVMVRSALEVSGSPIYWENWRQALFQDHASPLALVGISLLVFPKLALGLSGFETGVAVMPQVRGVLGDSEASPAGRIRNTRRLLLTAALIMSVFLVISSTVTTLLIRPAAFWPSTTTSASFAASDVARGRANMQIGLDDSAHPAQTLRLALPAGAAGSFSVDASLVAGQPARGTVPLSVEVQPASAASTVPGTVNVTVSKPAGEANGRALAYLAHRQFGNTFGTVYDFSTILILWFAGASAMAGLVNIVPRFLPRYGMAPEWTAASRPLVLIYTLVAVVVTLVFRANVDAQGGAYATGVLVLMTSASVAVALLSRARRERMFPVFALIALVFIYTTVANAVERPEGLLIGSIFILLILAVSLASRILRSFELRVSSVTLSPSAQALLPQESGQPLRFVAHHPGKSTPDEYHLKEMRARQLAHLPGDDPFLFLEVEVEDASDFSDAVEVDGLEVGPYRILRARGSSVPNTIAALLLHLRGRGGNGAPPQIYFQWSNTSPLPAALRFLAEGEGDVPPLTHEILRRSEPDKLRRPVVHVGG